jgi:ubiquinone/menaquinone biosynthesis C-methylase UbiE
VSTHPSAVQSWREHSARWIANADRIAAMTAPVSDALLARLAPARGARVLDLACGVGDPALRIAARVGPTGAVVAIDAVPPMLDELRERARALGLSNVETVCAEADRLDVQPASFDAACSRFGVMFFADAPRALAVMRGAVRAGGRLVVAAWSLPALNPYFTLAMSTLDAAGVPPLELPPGTRTVWEYAEPGLLAAGATRAGWHDVQPETVPFEMVVPCCAPQALLETYEQLSDKVATRLSGCDAARRQAARAALAEAAAPHVRGADIALPAEALLVSGSA